MTLFWGIFFKYNLEKNFFAKSISVRGFTAYYGMLMVDLHQNHPVVRVFCDQLVKSRANPRRRTGTVLCKLIGTGRFVQWKQS